MDSKSGSGKIIQDKENKWNLAVSRRADTTRVCSKVDLVV
jgi:hypothetical protein